MKTRITELFGIEHPIIQGGMHHVGLAEPEIQSRLLNAGAIAHFQSPAEMGQRVQQDYTRWGQLIRDKHIASE